MAKTYPHTNMSPSQFTRDIILKEEFVYCKLEGSDYTFKNGVKYRLVTSDYGYRQTYYVYPEDGVTENYEFFLDGDYFNLWDSFENKHERRKRIIKKILEDNE